MNWILKVKTSKGMRRECRLERKAASEIMLILLTIGMLSLAFNIQPAKSEWTGTVYIRADGSIDPPDAPIMTYDKITYTLTGNITSYGNGIIVERGNIIIDGKNYVIKGTKDYDNKGIMILANRNNVTIINTQIMNFWRGVYLYCSSNSNISGNNIVNNFEGVSLFAFSNSTISRNNIANNDHGMYLHSSLNNTISENNITANSYHGIFLVCSSNNIMSRNNIANNEWGMRFTASSNNTITENNIRANSWNGIWLRESSSNSFYHNNFIDNNQQVYIETSGYVNFWDNGYPSGGNYWSDYTGVDLKSGPNQDQPGSDGIGDTPYVIDENNTDRYPLMPTSLYVQGIDVSHHQGSVDWIQVYTAGYRFAFVKASEGVGWIDPNFEANMENGRDAGLLMGAYHFARPDLGNNPVDEAEYFISVASEYLGQCYLRPVLDLEKGASLGKDVLSNWVHIWMETVKNETGIEPILYVNNNYANNYLDEFLTKYDLWIAHWTYDLSSSPNTGIWDSWSFWQYSDKGSVPGIVGDVDLDLFNGDMQKLRSEFMIPAERMFYVSWEDKTYSIVVQSDSSVSHLIFDQPSVQISFILTGETGKTGYCYVTIPKSLLKGEPWTVRINGTNIGFQWEENATHSFIYFTYTIASTLEVTIKGTWVVPEFPSITIMLLMLMVVSIIASVKRKVLRRKFPT